MITRLLYRCPLCGAEPWLEAGRCRGCGADVQLGRNRSTAVIGGRAGDMAHWYAAVRRLDRMPPEGLASGPVAVALEQRRGFFRGAGGLSAVAYGRKPLGQARLHLDARRLAIQGGGLDLSIGLAQILAVTIESHTVIVGTRDQGVFFFDLAGAAGKRWEDALAGALAVFHQPRRIAEYCPRIRFEDEFAPPAVPVGSLAVVRSRPAGPGPTPTAFEMLRGAVRALLRVWLPLHIEGRDRLPVSGPVIVAANHSSFLDAILLSSAASRPIWFMTKNSQFDYPLLDRFLVWSRAFPVRRYTTDPVAVHNAMRILAGGHVLGLFPEGERCWDGGRLPFKRTTLRLLLAAGVPVVPVGISGAYGLMPRWSSRLKRGPVTVRFGPPLDLPFIPAGAQSGADLHTCNKRLIQAFKALGNRHQVI